MDIFVEKSKLPYKMNNEFGYDLHLLHKLRIMGPEFQLV